MKFTIIKKYLNEGLKIVEKTVSKSFNLPILENILISAQKNFLTLSGTDLETAITYKILAKIDEEGKTVIPVKNFYNYVSLLPGEKITLELEKNELKVRCNEYQSIFKTFNPEDFPIIPKIEEKKIVEINALPFSQGLSKVINVSGLEQTRPEISGIYFNFQKDFIKLVATDSFRLAEKTLPLQNPQPNFSGFSFILPHKSAKELMGILEEKEEKLRIYFGSSQVMFEYPSKEIVSQPRIQLISRLAEGDYPDYQKIIPHDFETELMLPRSEFLDQIRLASLFSGKGNEVRLIVDPEQKNLKISSQNPDLGENKSYLPVRIKGKRMELVFNWKFLLDGISKIGSPEVNFLLSGEEQPAMLKPVGREDYFYIVMPIKKE